MTQDDKLRAKLIEFGVLEENGGLNHCHRCECEMTTADDKKWGDELLQLIQSELDKTINLAVIEAKEAYHNEITANETKMWDTKANFDRKLIEARISELDKILSLRWSDEYSLDFPLMSGEDWQVHAANRIDELNKQKQALTGEGE